MLYLIEILHQTTTKVNIIYICGSCILSKFYIKPQPHKATSGGQDVVSYRNSTSNHNKEGGQLFGSGVVSYRNSTSNHNSSEITIVTRSVVSYRNSTSNHNFLFDDFCAIAVVSYRNSTSNHNYALIDAAIDGLYLIEILHQTTTTFHPYQNQTELYLIEILHQTTT